MRKVGIVIGALAGIVVIGIAVFLGYVWFVGGDGTPSEEVSAPTLVAEENQQVYRIDKEQSTVQFFLREDLSGVRTDVIGSTSEVAGDVLVDFNTPSNSAVGTIRVNARTLETDRSMRDRQIRTFILESSSDEYEFINFEPAEVLNFPESPEIGQELQFQIVGNLTIKDTTQSEVWDATVTLVSEDRMEGVATTTVSRGDYNLEIPRVASVANVDEEVQLTIEFVALAVDEETTFASDETVSTQ
ncbi:MAG: YceI family protein [Chloroflexi bacterium]|nr:YceI family protein [Chloroflexota bacterium]